MKRIAQIAILGLLVLLALAAYFAPPLPDILRAIRGQEGRYADIVTMERIMDSKKFTDLPVGFYELRRDYSDGSWIETICTDSHHGGGTVGVLESSGRRHFYFGHVCGPGEGIPIVLGTDRFDPQKATNPSGKPVAVIKVK